MNEAERPVLSHGVNAAGDNLHELLELWADTPDSMRMNVRTDASEDPVTLAAGRLNDAMSRIEGVTSRLRARAEAAEATASDARNADDDRARLAEALDVARSRESELQMAAQQASEALDRAIDDLRVMLDEE